MTAESRGYLNRLLSWFDTRLGLSYQLLRPVPSYAISPFYWLGALPVVAFLIQGLTGVMMMLYYAPSPAEAYSSTQYIFDRVYYGRFLETVHLYTAYAMIMLAFTHMMRDYFVSVHKKPRELMWIVGMIMGFVTLGFGFTGYLLPWTVVSKSATDVGVGMIAALPPPISSLISFLIVGSGGDSTELLRFYDLHVVVLPAVLLVLLTAKLYMLEVHGISEPTNTAKGTTQIAFFPDVAIYLMELAAIFGAAMLLVSAVFPLTLPPPYTPELASQFIPQPDWYFLWIYQILKISIFEGGRGLPVALSIVTLAFILILLLPFIDPGTTRTVTKRPIFVTLGLVFVGELVVLTYWGLKTPGQIIPVEQAVLVLGGTAILIGAISLTFLRFFKSRGNGSFLKTTPRNSGALSSAAVFVLIVSLGALMIGTSLSSIVQIILDGATYANVSILIGAGIGLSLTLMGSATFLYRLESRSGRVVKSISFLERMMK